MKSACAYFMDSSAPIVKIQRFQFMNLPNAENAIVPPEKLTDYLLSKSHLVGRWKASFFRSLGFNETNVNELRDALIDAAKRGEVNSTTVSAFGIKHEV